MPECRPKRRWYHITPDRLIIGLLAFEVFLLLSERFQWFAFNERKGWTVLIAVTAVCLVVVVMLLWLVVSLLFRWRFQFSLRSLVVLVVAVAVPLGWFGVKLREAERQRKAVEAIGEAGGWVLYDYQVGKGQQEQPASAWMTRLVGTDFFATVPFVCLSAFTNKELEGLGDEDAAIIRLNALTNVEGLDVSDTQVTDNGLKHFRGLQNLGILMLHDTHVTAQGINELQEALPNCEIHWTPPTPKTTLDQP